MAPRYEDTGSQAFRIDGLAGRVAVLEAENKLLKGELAECQDDVEALRSKPAAPEDRKLLGFLLDTRVILFVVGLAVICGSVAIVALVLSGNGGVLLELAKGSR
jgi:hypothetical protein